jgi:hypothetical protein
VPAGNLLLLLRRRVVNAAIKEITYVPKTAFHKE